MGAWGYGPFDNDTAADFMYPAVGDLDEKIRDVAETLKTRDRIYFSHLTEARAAIEARVAIDKAGYAMLGDELYNAHVVLENMLAGPAFVSRYDKPEEVRRSLRSRLAWVKKRLQQQEKKQHRKRKMKRKR